MDKVLIGFALFVLFVMLVFGVHTGMVGTEQLALIRYEVDHGITSKVDRYQIIETPESVKQGKLVIYDNETEEYHVTSPNNMMHPSE